MKILFIADPIENFKFEKDTTYFLMQAAFEKSYQVYFCEEKDIYINNAKVFANLKKINFKQNSNASYLQYEIESNSLESLDGFYAIFIRKDPPFDTYYLNLTYKLDFVSKEVKILNSTNSIRSLNEKMNVLNYHAFSVPTWVGASVKDALAFVKEQNQKFHTQRFSLKPIDGFGGRGIKFVNFNDTNIISELESMKLKDHHAFIVQSYIEEAKKGDLRVILCAGKVLGGFLRVHAEGKELNNLDQGGRAVAANLSAKQLQIAEILAEDCKKQKIFFAGIDFLGDFLTEINITSPTGLVQLSAFTNQKLHHHVIDSIANW